MRGGRMGILDRNSIFKVRRDTGCPKRVGAGGRETATGVIVQTRNTGANNVVILGAGRTRSTSRSGWP